MDNLDPNTIAKGIGFVILVIGLLFLTAPYWALVFGATPDQDVPTTTKKEATNESTKRNKN